jgi:hypothetical protein
MARLMDVHNGFVGVTAGQLREAHQAGHPTEEIYELPVEID